MTEGKREFTVRFMATTNYRKEAVQAETDKFWEMLENPPKHCEKVADLYHWSTNYESGQGPVALYLDLIGYSADEFGQSLYSGPDDFSGLGYVELSKLGAALVEYADAPRDVMEWVAEVLAAEMGD